MCINCIRESVKVVAQVHQPSASVLSFEAFGLPASLSQETTWTSHVQAGAALSGVVIYQGVCTSFRHSFA